MHAPLPSDGYVETMRNSGKTKTTGRVGNIAVLQLLQ